MAADDALRTVHPELVEGAPGEGGSRAWARKPNFDVDVRYRLELNSMADRESHGGRPPASGGHVGGEGGFGSASLPLTGWRRTFRSLSGNRDFNFLFVGNIGFFFGMQMMFLLRGWLIFAKWGDRRSNRGRAGLVIIAGPSSRVRSKTISAAHRPHSKRADSPARPDNHRPSRLEYKRKERSDDRSLITSPPDSNCLT